MSTSTDVASTTTISVRLDGDRVCVRASSAAPEGAPHLRPMLLASDATSARVALVPDGALLLADDHVRITVDVGPGAFLEIVEPGGTVAYDMEGRGARWDVSLEVADDAALLWHGEPFVVSAGASVERTTRLVVGTRARVGLREVVVLGRHGEAPGRLRQRMSCADAEGTPLLVDGIDLSARTYGPLLGGNPAMVSALALGIAPLSESSPTVRYELDRGGHLYRACAGSVHEAADDELWDQVARAIRSRTSNSIPTASAR